jgi:hypothetical protein
VQHVGPILILCSEDDELAPCSVVQNFGRRLLELGGDVNFVKWHSSAHVGMLFVTTTILQVMWKQVNAKTKGVFGSQPHFAKPKFGNLAIWHVFGFCHTLLSYMAHLLLSVFLPTSATLCGSQILRHIFVAANTCKI